MMAQSNFIDVEVRTSNLFDDGFKVIKFVRPSWGKQNIQMKVFDEGITNALAGFYLDGERKDIVLVRVYGNNTDLIIDRDAEKRNICLLHKAGCASELYASFKNGICYGFIHGDVLDEKMVRLPNIQRLIAEEMVRIHSLKPQADMTPVIFDKLRIFLGKSPDHFDDVRKQERYERDIPSKAKLSEEVESLISHLQTLTSTPAYTHNDLLLKNIVYNQQDERCYFIDHEYGCIGFLEYDIGNHFCEYAGVETVDYALYPDQEFQLNWLRYYLEARSKAVHGTSEVSDTDVMALYARVNKFALAAHLFWGIWGLIQAENSAIDFDFLDYAVIRLGEYFAKKDYFLELTE